MAFTPNTRVYLLDTPLDNKQKNQILFTSAETQRLYFENKAMHVFEGVTYQRKNNVIRVDKHIDDLWNVNYCMYQNTNFGSKWFYAFITKMEYASDRATDIYIETDVFQTWLFDCEIKESFVVREHVADDNIGKHLVDEQLETGEYKTDSFHPVNKLGNTYFILAVSDNSPMGSNELIGNVYGHVPTGLSYWIFEKNDTGITWLKNTIKKYTDAGKADAIQMLFTVPYLVIKTVIDSPDFTFSKPIPSGMFYGNIGHDENKNITDVDGYIPRNNKMFTFPYKFLYATNSNGLSATYRYEDFENNTMHFALYGALTPDPKIMLVPSSYKTNAAMINHEYGLVLSGFPLGSWTTDTYAAWLAQNTATTAVAMIGSGIALVGGIATGNAIAITGGALGVAHQLAQIHQASIQPDQAKGQVGGGGLMYGTGSLDFYFAHMTIKAEFAKRIDSFFTMYGYKVNTLKVPELKSRTNWNYVQTIDVNIDGAIPAEDMRQLKAIYDEGVTLWHTTDNFLDYSKSNPIR